MHSSETMSTVRLAGAVAMMLALAACSGSDRPSMADARSGSSSAPTSQSRMMAANASDAGKATAARADSDMAKVLTALQQLGGKPIETLSADEARRQPTPADAVKKVLAEQGKPTSPPPGITTRNVSIPSAGGSVPARLYIPEGSGPMPVVVYYHGGGWVIADIDTYDASARALAMEGKAIVLSSHYRQGPEHKFPAAHEDAFAAYRWALQNARSFGGDPSRIAVAGESAGGNLAANVAMMARENRIQMPVHQVLIYPVAGADMNTPSYQENANAKPLNKAMMAWFFDKYLRGEQDRQDPRINLVQANLRGLPPATVVTAEIDPLRSEGQMLAARLQQAGVPVAARTYEGVTHEFFGMGMVVDDAKEAQRFVGEQLRQAFSRAATGS